jgi:hypothetical protein
MTIEEVMLMRDELIKQFLITATYIRNVENLNIISYDMNENVIEINYSEKIENDGEVRVRVDSHCVSIFDYLSFIHIYNMIKVEERISQIGNGYLI